MEARLAKRQWIEIGQQRFRNATELRDYVQTILLVARTDELIVGDDFEFLLKLLHHHPHAQQKIGCGVEAFWVAPDSEDKTRRGFWLQRTDGSISPWSYMECLSSTSWKTKNAIGR